AVKNVDFDTEIGAYLIEPSKKSYDLDGLCADYIDVILDESANDGAQISLDSMLTGGSDDKIGAYAVAIFVLKEYEENEMKKRDSIELFETIEMPLVYVLASMEIDGIFVDLEKLSEFGERLKKEQNQLTDEIYAHAGHEFNINSPKQLATVLFEELELKAVKKTKSGYSTNAEVLEKLKWEHPIVEKILEYRKIAKLNSTYVEGLIPAIDSRDGKIHSSFNQTVTVTGRISSTEPNLQNIPVRTELGREMRKMFISKSNEFVLIDADYSQIELRVLAHIAQDENMISAFNSDFDIHSSTAAKIFNVEKDEVTSEMRSAAKAINFGLVYGMGEYSLSQDLKISVKRAKEYINDYLGSYPNVQKYMKETVEFAKENGYVTTMFGRRRDIPEIKATNYQTRAFGERVALNTPIQGSAADIIKLAMINVFKRLNKEKLSSKLILQVHDELIIEAPKGEVDVVCGLLKEEMESAAKLLVPLKVDMKVGRSWYDTK
ncbi:MAG: DNA polymerase I, partial [Clostridia bacterium]|nr:DNA polymerase I [Clostridia bacterium]